MKNMPQINKLLVVSMLVILIAPAQLVHSNYQGGQEVNPIHFSFLQGLRRNFVQSCQLMHNCALHFNGIDQWVRLGEPHHWDTPFFTLETWFKWDGVDTLPAQNTTSQPDAVPFIAIGSNPPSNQGANLSFGIQPSTGRLLSTFIASSSSIGSTSQSYSLLGNTTITPGGWHHAAVAYDGQTWMIFLDGALDASETLSTPVLPNLSGPLTAYLATSPSTNDSGQAFFPGSLDEVRIWEVARSQEEIQSSMNLQGIADANLMGNWSLDEGLGSNIASASAADVQNEAINSPTWTDGAPFNLTASPITQVNEIIDAAPNSPTVVSPANGATGVSTSPTLTVNASDPDANNLTVTFYGRIAPGTHRPDFTIVVLPDTQKYTVNGLGIFGIQTQWIVDQRSAQNIVFVSHLGDIVDDWNAPSQWNVADPAISKLEAAGIPFGLGVGNCDEYNYGTPPDTTVFNSYFPVSRFAGRSYYGGAYNNDNANSYQLFSASGMDFIIIHLKYNLSYSSSESSAILNWADTLLKNNPTRRAIVVNHGLLDTNNNFNTDGSQIFSKLKNNPNLFLMMGGHLDTEGRRQDTGTDGHIINSLRSDYQTRTNGGNGWLRVLRFSPDDNKIYVTTYSPYLNQFETDADSQFNLDYNMDGSSFQVIGSTDVTSGSNASVIWPNLASGVQYEWYATVNDGTSTTTGPKWIFTTGSGSSAPVITTHPVNQSVNAGQTASFTAVASGSPTPTVQWQVSTDGGSTWNIVSGATSTTYSFTALAADNGRQFRAVFTNSAGSATTNAATLTVYSAPAITSQPANQTVNAGQTASFSAFASGNPTPTIQWQSSTNGINWNNISGATSTTYSFTAQATDNTKQYRAVFTNSAGSATTSAALLTVYFAPAVNTQPNNQTVNAGQTASFSATASGNPAPTVQWQVSTNNGSTWNNVSGATSTNYSFTAQAIDDGNQYRATFTNPLGSVNSNTATLTVNTAPIITTQPANQTVNAGQTASFSAAASGNPTPTVQWQSSTNGTTWSNISGATSTTYSFTAQSSDNGKQYRAVFTNPAGSTNTNIAILTVYYAPVVTTQPADKTVNAGQTATFIATANGNPSPTVQWQVSTDGGSTWSNISGATSTTYSFTALAADNGKQFRAIFDNSAGSATTNPASLTVNTAPAVTTQPSDQTVNAGQTASFSAAASGNPTPTVQWQGSTNNGSTWSNLSGATSTTYSFTAQAADNGKQFRAVFTNVAGSATTSAALLTVFFAPTVTTQPTNQTVNAGQTASFSAAASSNPTPTTQWQVSTDNGSTWSNISGATSTVYSFITQAADNGKQYRAVFTNSVGSANTNSAILTVYTTPVITNHPSNQTVNAGQTASFSATASGNPTPTVQWQVSSNNGSTWSNISGATSTTYSFTTQAADNAKQYRAVFTNSVAAANTNPATLTVNYAPSVTSPPANQTVNAGQTASFSASAIGNPTPTVQWQVSANGTTWTDISGGTSTTYSFVTQAADNSKQYRAVFTNSIGSTITNSANLTVYFAPVVTTQPTNQLVNAGQNASFSTAANGNPSPTVQWQVSTNGGSTWSNISGATSTTYNFTAQTADNGKQYRAVFTNTTGSTATSVAVLTVYFAPSVTTQPANQAVNAGQIASFSAAANGNPSPTVQWQVSTNNGSTWSNISGATSTTFSFTGQAADNGKQYRAVFTNFINSATTNVVTLIVDYAPSVTDQPTNQTVNAGQTASFSAAASGNPSPTVQWQVSTDHGITWSNISGATSTTYNLSSQSVDNGKQYRAVFTNSVGNVNSAAATLTVNTAPVVILNPNEQTVNSGEMVTFNAAASGNPVPTVQWQVSTDGMTWTDISGATSATYIFTTTKADDGKQFRAVFSNFVGFDTSGAAGLTVNNHLFFIPIIIKSGSP